MTCALGKNPKHREDELNQEEASLAERLWGPAFKQSGGKGKESSW